MSLYLTQILKTLRYLISLELYRSLVSLEPYRSLISLELYRSLISLKLYRLLISLELYRSLISLELYRSLISLELRCFLQISDNWFLLGPCSRPYSEYLSIVALSAPRPLSYVPVVASSTVVLCATLALPRPLCHALHTMAP